MSASNCKDWCHYHRKKDHGCTVVLLYPQLRHGPSQNSATISKLKLAINKSEIFQFLLGHNRIWLNQILNDRSTSILFSNKIKRDQVRCSGSQILLSDLTSIALLGISIFEAKVAKRSACLSVLEHVFELDLRERSDELLNSSSIRNKSDLLHANSPLTHLMMSLEPPCTQTVWNPIRYAEMNPKTRASYSTSHCNKELEL